MPDAPSSPSPAELEDPAFEALWEHVLAHWDDEKAHIAFLEHCRELDRLLPAAKRYRGLAHSKRHELEVERRLKSIAVLAMSRMEQSRTSREVAKRQAGRFAALLFFLATATGLLIFYSLR